MSNSQPTGAKAELVSASAALPDVAQRARHRSARRLLPYLLVLYVIAYLDRMNIGAAALQMPHDLGFSPAVIGFGAGIFFCGYFILGFPGALIAERWSARKLMGYIMIGWGIVTMFMAFIHTAAQFYIVRFLLGATESGFFPGAIVYMSHWFRYEDRAKAVAVFYAANPLSYVIGSPLAGALLGLSWLGLAGWRWLFILEGIPALLFGIITLFYLTDWPHEAKWLRPEERDWITRQLQLEKEAKKRIRNYSIWEAIRHRDVILLTLCYFCAMTGSYGIGFWLPTIVKRLSGLSDLKVTLISALPYVAAIIVQQVNGWHSDRTRERRWHSAMPVFLCGTGLALAVLFGSKPVLSIALLVLAGGAFYGFQPVFWTVPTIFLGESAAAASIGMINSVGNLGGFLGPMVMGLLTSQLHSFSAALLYLVVSLLMAGILVLAVGVRSGAGMPRAS